MDVKTFDKLLHDVETKMKRLRALYEQYFQGIERMEPTVPRKDLERLFQTLHKEKPRNTAARFRLQQLQASYNTYLTYWGRITRQIEEGTYERDIRRANRRGRRPMDTPVDTPGAYELDLDVDVDTDDILAALESIDSPAPAPSPSAGRKPLTAFSPFAGGLGAPAARPAPAEGRPTPSATFAAPDTERPPAPSHPVAPVQVPRAAPAPASSLLDLDRQGARPAPPRPPAAASGQVARPAPPRPPATTSGQVARPAPPRPPTRVSEDARMRRLYDDYVAARQRNNERVDNLAFDKLRSSVAQMESKLRERHRDKNIDFEVVVQNGRVGLKPKIG